MDPTIKPGKQAGKRAALFIFPLVLAAFLLLIHPGGIIVGVEKNSPPPVITIEEAKELALAYNRQITDLEVRIAELDGEVMVERLEDQLDGLRSSRSAVRNAISALEEKDPQNPNLLEMHANRIILDESIDALRDQMEAAEKRAEHSLEITRLAQEEKAEETLLSVGERYAGLLMLVEQLTAQEEAIAQLNEHLRLLEKRFTVGFVTEIDVEQMRARIRAATAGLQALEHKKTQAHQALAMFMGLAADASFTTEQFTPKEPSPVDFNALLAQELLTGWAVRRARLTLDNAIEVRGQARDDHGRGSLEYEVAEVSVELAELEVDRAQDEVHSGLLARYHRLLEAEESLLNSRADLDLARLEHTAAEALFETGRITAVELADSTLSLLEKELALQEARYNYHNAFSRLTPDPPQ